MSFRFTRRVPTFRYCFPGCDSSDDCFDLDGHHYTLVFVNPEPDYDELLFRLSRYAFDRLSPRDQQEQVEELRRLNVELDGVLDIVEEQGPEESEEAFRRRAFAKLFKKLSHSHQPELFLLNVIAKFKRERQLCRGHTRNVSKCLTNINNSRGVKMKKVVRLVGYVSKICCIPEGDQDEESGSDWKSCFAEFFLGFSKIWFEGQSKRSQDMLIQQLSHEFKGVALNKRPADESEEDFKLRKFTELCQKVADFVVQDRFLHFAEVKLRGWILDTSKRLVGELQDPDSAAHLLSRLSIFGFSRLSAQYQQSLIEFLSKQVEGHLAAVEDITDDQEDIGVKTFTKLFYQVRVSTQIDIFRKMRQILLQQKRRSEAVRFFIESCSCQDQIEIMDALARVWSPTVTEKFCDESEEDFRLRKFTKLYMERDDGWGNRRDIPKKYAEFLKQVVQEGTFDYNDECPPYAEFLFDVSTAWFKTQCVNYWRNPIHVILFGNVDNRDVIEKLPEESEEDFRLRRFVESFKRLEFKSQERIVDYIVDAFEDLPVRFLWKLSKNGDLAPEIGLDTEGGAPKLYEKSPGPFDSQWIVMEEIEPDQGAGANSTGGAAATITPGAAAGTGTVGSATTTQAAANITPGAAAGTGAVGSATTTQAGGGTRQGTSRP